MTVPTATAIETACLKAWPALQTQYDGQWVVRFARGYSKRANSVQSLDVGDDANAFERIEAIAQLYRAQGLMPTFRVTPLAGPAIVAALDAKGWAVFEQSLVLAMPLSKTARPVAAMTKYFAPTDPEWLSVQGFLAELGPSEAASLALIVEQINVPARGVVVYDENYQPAGAALAVNADGIAVFLNVVVGKAARGQGLGRVVMNGALNWTGQSGASHAALQVLGTNAVAQSLYHSLGFAEIYSYHYRRAPQ